MEGEKGSVGSTSGLPQGVNTPVDNVRHCRSDHLLKQKL